MILHQHMVEKYRHLIFDVDGVLFDSNSVKERNIKEVVSYYISGNELRKFIDYFVSNNGVPRETKIRKFFDARTTSQILQEYHRLNTQFLPECKLVPGVQPLLEIAIRNNIVMYVLSGGDEKEVVDLLKKKKLISLFSCSQRGASHKRRKFKGFTFKRFDSLFRRQYV